MEDQTKTIYRPSLNTHHELSASDHLDQIEVPQDNNPYFHNATRVYETPSINNDGGLIPNLRRTYE